MIAGGLAWYFLQKGGPSPPPPPPPGCQGSCFWEGATDCDANDNLCKCINGEWTLLEPNSEACLSGIKHNECFPSIPGNIITCLPIPGIGADLCDDLGFSGSCPCIDASCDVFHLCDTRVFRCIKKASNISISADNSNWEQCQASTNFDWCQCPDCSGRTCDYALDKEYAATTLIGTFGWEWSFWGSEFTLRVYGYLDGVGWTLLGQKMITSWGATGEAIITLQFAAQGISKLRFACCDDLWINTKPKYFYGHITM